MSNRQRKMRHWSGALPAKNKIMSRPEPRGPARLLPQQDPRAGREAAQPALLGVERGARIELAAFGADAPADHGTALADRRRLDDLGGHAAGHRRPEVAVILRS